MAASTHIFTVQVECENGDDYTEAVRAINSVGEIISEE